MAVDTFFTGTLKGVGKGYIQTVLDCFSRYVWARLYALKMQVTAVQILNNDVLPFFEEDGVKIWTILSDNGREYCGPAGQAPLRVLPTARGHRAPHHPGGQASGPTASSMGCTLPSDGVNMRQGGVRVVRRTR